MIFILLAETVAVNMIMLFKAFAANGVIIQITLLKNQQTLLSNWCRLRLSSMIGYKSYLSLCLSIYAVLPQSKPAFGAEENPVFVQVHQSHWKVNAYPCAPGVELSFLPDEATTYLFQIPGLLLTQSIQIILLVKDTEASWLFSWTKDRTTLSVLPNY